VTSSWLLIYIYIYIYIVYDAWNHEPKIQQITSEQLGQNSVSAAIRQPKGILATRLVYIVYEYLLYVCRDISAGYYFQHSQYCVCYCFVCITASMLLFSLLLNLLFNCFIFVLICTLMHINGCNTM
jgi:hypothetical protein